MLTVSYGFPVVGDDQFGDPQIAAAAHAPDDELSPCRVVATLALDVASPAEPLARLWILKDRIIGVDRMLRGLVPRLRCCPMTLDGDPTIGICHGCLNSASVCTADPSGEAAPAVPTQSRFTTLLARLADFSVSTGRIARRNGRARIGHGSAANPHPAYQRTKLSPPAASNLSQTRSNTSATLSRSPVVLAADPTRIREKRLESSPGCHEARCDGPSPNKCR